MVRLRGLASETLHSLDAGGAVSTWSLLVFLARTRRLMAVALASSPESDIDEEGLSLAGDSD